MSLHVAFADTILLLMTRDTDAYIADHHPRAFFEFLAQTGLGAQILGSTKYSGAWILLDRDQVPTWLRENKGKQRRMQRDEESAVPQESENPGVPDTVSLFESSTGAEEAADDGDSE